MEEAVTDHREVRSALIIIFFSKSLIKVHMEEIIEAMTVIDMVEIVY